MKKLFELVKRFSNNPFKKKHTSELEKKVVKSAKKAVEEYRRVFERLAEHDRT